MNAHHAAQICDALPGAWRDYPFGPDFLVFKVGEGKKAKMFAGFGETPAELAEEHGHPPGDFVVLKADRDLVEELRLVHPEVLVPRYFNKAHWNHVCLTETNDPDDVADWVDHSYRLVVASLPKRTGAPLLVQLDAS